MNEEYFNLIDIFIDKVKSHNEWWIGSSSYGLSTWRNNEYKFDLNICKRVGINNIYTYKINHANFKIIKVDRYPIFLESTTSYIRTSSYNYAREPNHKIEYEIEGDAEEFAEIAMMLVLRN